MDKLRAITIVEALASGTDPVLVKPDIKLLFTFPFELPDVLNRNGHGIA